MEKNSMEKLLKILETNCKYSLENLGAMLDESEEAVESELLELEKQGIIRGYKAIIDWDKTQRDFVTALIEIKVSPKANQGFDEIAQKIMSFPEVESVSLMSGGFDLLAIIVGKTLKDVAFFVSGKLGTLDSVLSTSTHFFLKKYKDNGFCVVKEDEGERGQNAL